MRVLLISLIAFASAIPDSAKSDIDDEKDKMPTIIGGKEASIGSHSWQVAILKNTKFVCGGVLISPDYVLTAAQCLDGAGSIVVQLGAHNQKKSEPSQVLKSVNKEHWFIHSNYNNPPKSNDIALLLIFNAVELSDKIQPIQLPLDEDLYPNESEIVRLTGWGQTSDDNSNGKTSDVLMEVILTAISTAECQIYLSDIDEKIICTKGGLEGPCFYDVGGPISYTREDSVTVLAGIASYLPDDGCRSIYPRQFTRISTYRQWIRERTGL